MLQAGYLEDWIWHATLSAAHHKAVWPPRSSPIFICTSWTVSSRKSLSLNIPEVTPGHPTLNTMRRTKQLARAAQTRGPPSGPRAAQTDAGNAEQGPDRSGFRRLRYVRYCDDHLLGFTGPKAEAEEIKIRLAGFLRDELKLELSQEKTLITHARTGAARFLGYEIIAQHADHKVERQGPSRERRCRPACPP